MNRYPIVANELQQQALAQATQKQGTRQNMSFEITKDPKKWKGETSGTAQNAYDFLFSQDKVDGLCTIINADNL